MRMSEDSTRAPTERWAAHWYAVARASTLGAKQPLGVERLGQRLVLWRDTSGAVRCADAACPHRGADLGLGRVLQGQLECPYHGFRYDAAGACTLTPCEGAETKPSRALCLRLHPVREAHGLLWVYLGAPSSKPLPELPWIPGACEPDRHGATTEAVWNARFSRVMDAHRRYAPPGYTRLDPYEVRVEDGLIRTQGGLRKQAAAPGTGLRFEIHIRVIGHRLQPGDLLLQARPQHLAINGQHAKRQPQQPLRRHPRGAIRNGTGNGACRPKQATCGASARTLSPSALRYPGLRIRPGWLRRTTNQAWPCHPGRKFFEAQKFAPACKEVLELIAETGRTRSEDARQRLSQGPGIHVLRPRPPARSAQYRAGARRTPTCAVGGWGPSRLTTPSRRSR